MNQTPGTPGGSRWEPTPEPVAPPTPEPPVAAPAPPTDGTAGSRRSAWSLPTRPSRGALGAVAAGLVLVSGVGGFAVGRVSAPESDFGLVSDTGPGAGHVDREGDGGRGPDSLPGPPDHQGSVPDGVGEDAAGGSTT